MRAAAIVRALLPLSPRWAMDSLRWVPWLHLLPQQRQWQLLRQVRPRLLGRHQTLATLEMVSQAKPLQQQAKLPQPRLLHLLFPLKLQHQLPLRLNLQPLRLQLCYLVRLSVSSQFRGAD
jgi:hypothetical protein